MKMNKIVAFLLVAYLACADAKIPQTPRIKDFDKINWKNFMTRAIWNTNELFKVSAPYVIENYPAGNVSEKCTKALVSYADGIKSWKKWSIRMFDDTGKLPSSFKKGAGIEFGAYDDCVRIDISTDEAPVPFVGQFCMLQLQTSVPFLIEEDTPFKKYASLLVPNFESTKRVLNLHLGICTPSTCTTQDLHNIVTSLTKFTNVTVKVSNCETKEEQEWLKPTKYALSALAILLGLCFIGTRLDIQDREQSENGVLNSDIFRQSLKAFSFRANILTIFDKESVNVEIRRICGVMFFWCVWIMACNTIIYPTPWKEMRYTTFKDISMAVRIADSFVIAMDAMFFISGFLSIFVLCRNAEKAGSILHYFKEFLRINFRLSAVTAFTILLSFLFPLIYYGPLWHQTWNNELIKCQNNGWMNLLNLQTQLPISESCWLHTWYPALGMQFFLASLPLVFLLYRYPKMGFVVGIMLAAVIGNTEIAFSTKVIDSLQYFKVIQLTVDKFYKQPLFYFLPYLLGILAGRIAIEFKDQQLSNVVKAVGWGVSMTVCVSVLTNESSPEQNLDKSSSDLTKRTFYLCTALSWIMYGSIVDGIVGRILSSGAIWFLARVSYIAYMMNVVLITMREAALKERIYIGKLALTLEATSQVVLALFLGIIIQAIVELPFLRLYELYIGRSEEDESKEITADSHGAEASEMDDKKDS